MKNFYLLILVFLFFFLLSANFINPKLNQPTNKYELTGEYYINDGGSSGSEFLLDSSFQFKQYSWSDICPGKIIYGRWEVKNNMLILTDTLKISLTPHFLNVTDSIYENIYKKDTLIIRYTKNEKTLCPNFTSTQKKWVEENELDINQFGCYKQK